MKSEPFDWCVPMLSVRADLLVTAVTSRVNGMDLPLESGRGADACQPAVTAVTRDARHGGFAPQTYPPRHADEPAVTEVSDVTPINEQFECVLRCRGIWAVLTPSHERSEQWTEIGVTAFSMAEMAVIATMAQGQVMPAKVWDALIATKKVSPAARVVEK